LSVRHKRLKPPRLIRALGKLAAEDMLVS
jgi:hypothetical protein